MEPGEPKRHCHACARPGRLGGGAEPHYCMCTGTMYVVPSVMYVYVCTYMHWHSAGGMGAPGQSRHHPLPAPAGHALRPNGPSPGDGRLGARAGLAVLSESMYVRTRNAYSGSGGQRDSSCCSRELQHLCLPRLAPAAAVRTPKSLPLGSSSPLTLHRLDTKQGAHFRLLGPSWSAAAGWLGNISVVLRQRTTNVLQIGRAHV